MASLQEISILDLPDEVIESIMSCLSHTDLFNLFFLFQTFNFSNILMFDFSFSEIAILVDQTMLENTVVDYWKMLKSYR